MVSICLSVELGMSVRFWIWSDERRVSMAKSVGIEGYRDTISKLYIVYLVKVFWGKVRRSCLRVVALGKLWGILLRMGQKRLSRNLARK